MLLLAVVTVVVGALIGMSGVGGVLLIPCLGILAELPTRVSMGTALFSFLFTGLLATWLYQRHGSIDWKLTLPLCLGAILSGYAGARANAVAPVLLLNVVLAAVIIFSGLFSLLGKGRAGGPAASGKGALFVIGLVVGFGSGLTGVGGPVLSVPIMLVCGFPPLASVAAGQVVQVAGALSGSVGNLAAGVIDFHIVWWITALQLAGVVVGARLAHAVSAQLLKRLVALLCVGVGLFILARAFLGPVG